MQENADTYYLIIEAKKTPAHYFRELYRYKELFLFLAWRDILVRYKQAAFGIAWALFRPLLSMAVFAFIFGNIAKLPSENISYPLFVLAGVIPWLFISNSVVDTCPSLVNNTHLISKIYFPRVLIPTAQTTVTLVDFAVSAALMLVVGAFTGSFHWLTLLTLPFWIVLMVCFSVGLSLWLSALTVRYRDFRILVPFFVQFGMFVSPVGYGTAVVPEKWILLYSLNPAVGIIDGFRWAFFGISHPAMGLSIGCSIAITLCILLSGFAYFRKTESTFVDTI